MESVPLKYSKGNVKDDSDDDMVDDNDDDSDGPRKMNENGRTETIPSGLRMSTRWAVKIQEPRMRMELSKDRNAIKEITLHSAQRYFVSAAHSVLIHVCKNECFCFDTIVEYALRTHNRSSGSGLQTAAQYKQHSFSPFLVLGSKRFTVVEETVIVVQVL
ncbi:hypothetical protein AC578_5739 [Pseudocercospora eumusae]|uniref:Uncharacterized protein n=1 Tax=Pseudocercospora eumusae TaxID=321146 RepID=A0A139H568_9PEZI|nr:hypothetical protein AC578_5739 [Pseudocercospora eumusae]